MRFRMTRPPAGTHQVLLPFLDRTLRRERQFKLLIVAITVAACATLIAASSTGRYAVGSFVAQTRLAALRMLGPEPDRSELDRLRQIKRQRSIDRTFNSLSTFYRGAPEPIKTLFDVAAMDPDHAVIGSGRASDAFVLSSDVFAPDDHGRSYRLLPNRRSVWLRQVTLRDGPFGLFLVADNPKTRKAAEDAHAIVDEPSVQTTNSWGLRGPEPDPNAPARGIVLGDSFMQGMFNGDDDTPPMALQRELSRLWNVPVSVLNGGHIGYSPEQYFRTLEEYGDRFDPQFVVVSVCPNDFGNGEEVMNGGGDEWDEAAYWLGEITRWCRSHAIPCVLVPVPCDVQILGVRKDGRYPAPISNMFQGSGLHYCNALDQFIDEHLRLKREAALAGKPSLKCDLYNGHIDDNHFSPRGAELWAKIVARRLNLILTPPEPIVAGSVGTSG